MGRKHNPISQHQTQSGILKVNWNREYFGEYNCPECKKNKNEEHKLNNYHRNQDSVCKLVLFCKVCQKEISLTNCVPAPIARYRPKIECPNPLCTGIGHNGQKGWVYTKYSKYCKCHFCGITFNPKSTPVVFFSAEMSNEQLTKRFLSMHSGINSYRLMHNEIYEDEYDVLVSGLTKLAELPIIIDDTPAIQLTPSRVRSVLRRIRSENGKLGLVVLDYIQKLGDRACRNRAQTVGKFSGAFKDIAKEFDVPFVALAQINRGVESMANKRPLMSDIKDSGDIEQDMDLGLMLYRDEYYNPDTTESGIMEIIVGKNRNGSIGNCHIQFDPSIGRFVSLQCV